MSYSGGRIYIGDGEGISVSDVRSVLGVSSTDVGTLCCHSNVNPWSKRKPVRFNKVSKLTDEDWKQVETGRGVPVDASASFSALLEEGANRLWSYFNMPPDGSWPKRLGDFDNYYHNAKFYPVIKIDYTEDADTSQTSSVELGKNDGEEKNVVWTIKRNADYGISLTRTGTDAYSLLWIDQKTMLSYELVMAVSPKEDFSSQVYYMNFFIGAIDRYPRTRNLFEITKGMFTNTNGTYFPGITFDDGQKLYYQFFVTRYASAEQYMTKFYSNYTAFEFYPAPLYNDNTSGLSGNWLQKLWGGIITINQYTSFNVKYFGTTTQDIASPISDFVEGDPFFDYDGGGDADAYTMENTYSDTNNNLMRICFSNVLKNNTEHSITYSHFRVTFSKSIAFEPDGEVYIGGTEEDCITTLDYYQYSNNQKGPWNRVIGATYDLDLERWNHDGGFTLNAGAQYWLDWDLGCSITGRKWQESNTYNETYGKKTVRSLSNWNVYTVEPMTMNDLEITITATTTTNGVTKENAVVGKFKVNLEWL